MAHNEVTMDSLIADAEKQFEERWADEAADEDEAIAHERAGDLIFEIADSAVPCYTAGLLEVAGSDLGLMFEETDGDESTPSDLLQRLIFNRVYEALWAKHEELEADAAEEEGN